jgi:hypothetical protein
VSFVGLLISTVGFSMHYYPTTNPGHVCKEKSGFPNSFIQPNNQPNIDLGDTHFAVRTRGFS